MLRLSHLDEKNIRKFFLSVKMVGATTESTYLLPMEGQGTYADSGATVYCFHSKSFFVPGSVMPGDRRSIRLADGTSVWGKWPGEVILRWESANSCLQNVLFTPNVGFNLLSTGRLADNGIESRFRLSDARFSVNNGTTRIAVVYGRLKSQIFTLPKLTIDCVDEHCHVSLGTCELDRNGPMPYKASSYERAWSYFGTETYIWYSVIQTNKHCLSSMPTCQGTQASIFLSSLDVQELSVTLCVPVLCARWCHLFQTGSDMSQPS